MKLIKFQRGGRAGQGVLQDEQIYLIGGWHDGPADVMPFTLPAYTVADLEAAIVGAEVIDLASVTLAVPIDPLRKIICVGMNYRDHTAEIKVEVAPNPVLFTRPLDSLVAAGQPVIRPVASEKFDFEGEIAIVIGQGGRHIDPGQAWNHVGGFTCFMDGSVRDYQRHSLTAGKNFWQSGAMGPWIVTADEVDQDNLRLVTRLNGTVVQSACATDMIFSIPDIIAYCSRWTLLSSGDVIATGTPGGVGSRRNPPLWMRPGDTIEVCVTGVGSLENSVQAET